MAGIRRCLLSIVTLPVLVSIGCAHSGPAGLMATSATHRAAPYRVSSFGFESDEAFRVLAEPNNTRFASLSPRMTLFGIGRSSLACAIGEPQLLQPQTKGRYRRANRCNSGARRDLRLAE